MLKLSKITVHGRFQPPLHVNHWNYVNEGFKLADYVTILITNPFQDEGFDSIASWRNDPANNPFTYEERVFMWDKFLKTMDISKNRYNIKPFNIKDSASFAKLNSATPNLVNVYSEWSAKKVEEFQKHGLKVIRLDQAKVRPVSGTLIREIIKNTPDLDELSKKIVEAGFMPEAVLGLLQVLHKKNKSTNQSSP